MTQTETKIIQNETKIIQNGLIIIQCDRCKNYNF